MATITRIIESALTDFITGIESAIPKLISGIVFLVLAYLTIKVILTLVRSSLRRLYPVEEELIANLITTIVAIFLWFGAALAFLTVIGMSGIAASLGTATGFIALGISYALSEMIEDTVSGVYLLRDPDFNIGDRIHTESAAGTVASIELRKSRIETDDGDRIVLANREIEGLWTRELPDVE